jgi:hypothetical protein
MFTCTSSCASLAKRDEQMKQAEGSADEDAIATLWIIGDPQAHIYYIKRDMACDSCD